MRVATLTTFVGFLAFTACLQDPSALEDSKAKIDPKLYEATCTAGISSVLTKEKASNSYPQTYPNVAGMATLLTHPECKGLVKHTVGAEAPFVGASGKADPSKVDVTHIFQITDIERCYVPFCVACEAHAQAGPEALKAHAIACRSHLRYYRAVEQRGTPANPLEEGEGTQEFLCEVQPKAKHFEAAQQTAGVVLVTNLPDGRYQSAATFYVQGARPNAFLDKDVYTPTGNIAKDCSGSEDPALKDDKNLAKLESYVTLYTEQRSTQGSMEEPRNVGSMSQRGAVCLEDRFAMSASNILRAYYGPAEHGQDVRLLQTKGACVDEVKVAIATDKLEGPITVSPPNRRSAYAEVSGCVFRVENACRKQPPRGPEIIQADFAVDTTPRAKQGCASWYQAYLVQNNAPAPEASLDLAKWYEAIEEPGQSKAGANLDRIERIGQGPLERGSRSYTGAYFSYTDSPKLIHSLTRDYKYLSVVFGRAGKGGFVADGRLSVSLDDC